MPELDRFDLIILIFSYLYLAISISILITPHCMHFNQFFPPYIIHTFSHTFNIEHMVDIYYTQ